VRAFTTAVATAVAAAGAMKRSPLVVAFVAAAGISAMAPSGAMTLGNVASQSELGQSLRLVIPVALGADEVISASCLKLLNDGAPGDTPQLVTGKVSFERGAPMPRIVVTTSRPINEPALRVSLQSGCGNTTRRDYVLLFDPATVPSTPSLPMLALAAGTPTVQDAPLPTTLGGDARNDNYGVAHAQAAKTVAQAPLTARHDERAARAPSPPAVATLALRRSSVSTNVASPVALTEVALREIPASTTAPHAEAASTSLRLVTMTRSASGNGFISTASAQPLQPVAQPSPTVERLWPYAAVVLCLAGLGMCAFAVRKQRASHSPSWMATANAAAKTPPDTYASLNTFAHFGEMAEPVPATPRDSGDKRQTKPAMAASDGELDTLLGDDCIDEQKIRQEWAAAASEHAIDIGTDSILQAIATAEREMRIGAPAPAQAAMDSALDDELLRKPKPKKR
jgi:hypothetical protein